MHTYADGKIIIHILIFGCLFIHLFLECFVIFLKYGYASIGYPLVGGNAASFIGLVSRIFIGLYAVLVSYSIESSNLKPTTYAYVTAGSFFLATIFAFWLARLRISENSLIRSNDNILKVVVESLYGLSINPSKNLFIIKFYLWPLVGVQFSALVVTYFFAIIYPENRLLIVSMSPIFSMIGSLFSIAWVEAKMANVIDMNTSKGLSVLKEVQMQRVVSYFIVGISFLIFAFWLSYI